MTDWQGNNPNINNPYLLISNYIKPPLALRRLTKEREKGILLVGQRNYT